MPREVLIVGAGIVGLAHALAAHEAGCTVTVCERHARPLGASVRNFGTIWPLGQRADTGDRARALRGRARWLEVATAAGFGIDRCGALFVAQRPEAVAVLDEYVAAVHAHDASFAEADGFTPDLAGRPTVERLDHAALLRSAPGVRGERVHGGLISHTEAVVDPPQAIAAIVAWLASRGVTFRFETTVVDLEDGVAVTAARERLPFDQAVVASGDEARLLLPETFAADDLVRCKLQMMRTAPQPAGHRIGPILASDLTIRHYGCFAACPSLPALSARLDDEEPRWAEFGIHVLAAQGADGRVRLGDSHEYADDFDPWMSSEIESLILDEFDRFATVPDRTIADRWTGTYLKSTAGRTRLHVRPRPGIEVVTAVGGAGMTLAFAIAEETVAAWTAEAVG